MFSLKDSFLQIKSEKCVNCTDCFNICLENAIQIIPEIKKIRDTGEPLHTKKCIDCGQSFSTFQFAREKCPLCINRDPEWLSPYQ